MKKLFAVVAFAAISLPARAVVLVRDGKSLAKIYVMPKDKLAPTPGMPARAELPVITAARELNYHLQKMSGATLEVVETADAKSIKGPAIVLGELARTLGATAKTLTRSREGVHIIARGDTLLIGGETDESSLLGTYSVLEKLGCDWVMPGVIGEIIPAKATVDYPNGDEVQAPSFSYRNLWYRGGTSIVNPPEFERFAQWTMRQRGGGSSPIQLASAGHYWDQFIGKHKADFDKDPTMYALTRDANGALVRGGPQIESSHPRVIELMAQDIRDAYAKNNWRKDKAASFAVGPADGLGYSFSAEAMAAGSGRIDPIVGELDRTDDVVLLANSVLEKLGAEYPNVYMNFYSYSVHADYPKRYVPNSHLIPIFAPINFSRFHSLFDANSKTQAYYRNVVSQWGKAHNERGNILQYRGYNWNLAENMLPYSKLKIWGEEIPFYQKMGFEGSSVEATKAWSVNGPSDYLYMKLLWNSSLKWREVLSDYCRKSFGAGAPAMERYFLRLVERQHNAGQEAGSYYGFAAMYDDAWVKQAQGDMNEAANAAQTPEQKTRVAMFADNVEALRLYLAYTQVVRKQDFAGAKAGYDAMLAHWQKQYDANPDLVAKEVPQYLERFLQGFVDVGLKYSTGDYKIVAPLPDELPTIFDPNTVGDRMNLFAPEVNDRGWIRTHTYGASYESQGLGNLRAGAVWYHHRFAVPADARQPLGLFLGGFEDEARVWINGRFVGSANGFSIPAAFDLSDGVKPGENVLAIQIIRNSLANEIGLGGILQPSFLFSGPKLATPAPIPAPKRRVLPGGELGEIIQ